MALPSGVLLKMEVDIRKGGVAKGLKVPCLFMITEVSIRCQKKPGGWYTAYTHVYPPNTPLSEGPLKYSKEVWGSTARTPSGVWAEIKFGAF